MQCRSFSRSVFLGLMVSGGGFRIRVEDLGFRVWAYGSGWRIWDLGLCALDTLVVIGLGFGLKEVL